MNRRAFAGGMLATGALPFFAGRMTAAQAARTPAYPPLLDHLVWLAGDLDAACARFAAMSGITPAYGGRHPGGTHNALVALGSHCYLEIAAPQPGASADAHPWIAAAARRPEPRLYAYCMRSTVALETLAERVRGAGHGVMGPSPGSRTSIDGRVLHWRLLIPLVAGAGGAAPFLIDWLESAHPAADAPAGASLSSFSIEHPDPPLINAALDLLAPGMRADAGAAARLTARIATPRGAVALHS